jgi:hypothetical protein
MAERVMEPIGHNLNTGRLPGKCQLHVSKILRSPRVSWRSVVDDVQIQDTHADLRHDTPVLKK